MKTPSNPSELRSLLGFANCYRCYVPDFSAKAEPLNKLLGKDVTWGWDADQIAAWAAIKSDLTTEGRALKRYDAQRPLILHTDFCNQGIGAVLSQVDDDNNEYMVACISRSLNVHEKNYDSPRGEMLAAVWAAKMFRHYLHGQHFTLVTDHQPLQWLLTNNNLSGQHARWALSMQEFDFDIVHRAGKTHQNADVPSRFALDSVEDGTGARLDEEDHSRASAVAMFAISADEWFSVDHDFDHPGVCCHVTASDVVKSHVHINLYHAALAASSDCTDADVYMPTWYQLNEGHNGWCTDAMDCPPDQNSAEVVGCQRQLLQTANTWLHEADSKLRTWTRRSPWLPGRYEGPMNDAGLRPTQQLNTSCVNGKFFTSASEHGVVVLELFGGICAGLEMALRNGLTVSRYIYCDYNSIALKAAQHRVDVLACQYPSQLSLPAIQDAFVSLPLDVTHITPLMLRQLAAKYDSYPWLVVAGWPCQDLSPAGLGAGLDGSRSRLFFTMLDIIGILQQLCLPHGIAYIIENSAMQYNYKSTAVCCDAFQWVCDAIGEPVVVDAAQFGGYSHRLRDFWTNLADASVLQQVINLIVRDPARVVDDVLCEGCFTTTVRKDDAFPYYCCNKVGEPLRALPTFVSVVVSRGYRPLTQGMIFDTNTKQCREPVPNERERALGYDDNATAFWGSTFKQRHELLGQCMDQFTLQSLLALCAAMYYRRHQVHYGVANTATVWHKQCVSLPVSKLHATYGKAVDIMANSDWQPGQPLGRNRAGIVNPIALRGTPAKHGLGYVPHSNTSKCSERRVVGPSMSRRKFNHCLNTAYVRNGIYCMAASVVEAVSTGNGTRDVWEDTVFIQAVQTGVIPDDVSPAERKRVAKRMTMYRWQNGTLLRVLTDGSLKTVPPIADRDDLIRQVHESCGHWGEKRTVHLVSTRYCWKGLYSDVCDVVKRCTVCSRVNTSFNSTQPTLQPLPICGLFYRWGVDLCGPFPLTKHKNLYVMVMVEYFSKHIELAALPNKEPETTRRGFLQHVITHFGAPAEVVTDCGSEWKGAFHDLLESCFVDHRHTSPNHPQADGLAERAVQSIKNALKKHIATTKQADDWEEYLCWIGHGYNCAPQSASGFSPYFVLYARHPVITPAVKQVLEEPLSLQDTSVAAASLLKRAAAAERAGIIISSNLKIAQHRDSQRYAKVRGGGYLPRIYKYQPGDFVYVKRSNKNSTLQIAARLEIYQIVELRDSGAVIVRGKCGTTVSKHISQITPCHLPDIDPTINPALARNNPDLACEVCDNTDRESAMLLCDGCGAGYHIFCLEPPLGSVPRGAWVCLVCTAAGLTPEAALQRQRQQQQCSVDDETSILPTAATKRRDKYAEQHPGRLVVKKFSNAKGKLTDFWGRVEFRGAQARPSYFLVHYQDGESLYRLITFTTSIAVA
eukprot:jgi/Chrzof1/7868/Cz02g39130.t1